MKLIAWVGGILAAGLLLGYALRLAVTTTVAHDAVTDATASTAIAAAAPADADKGPYQVGDHLQPDSRLSSTPYQPIAKSNSTYREISWEALIPKDWDIMAPFKGMKLDQMDDGDPRAMEALSNAKNYWKTAPVDPSMNGASIRIPGFVVSLEREGEALKEFLLVPYFGACIHVPPPPANQIIHVNSAKPIQHVRTMDAVWINGVLKVERSDTLMGSAGYSMQAVSVEPYTDQVPQ